MRIALEVWSADHRRVEAACRRAEELGIDAFYYGESPNDLNLECWTMLGALAAVTDRIRLGPVIANVLPAWRHTALLARQAAAVATISGGRLDLRTGVGAAAPFARPWWEPAGVDYPDYGQRLADLADALVDLPGRWRTAPPIPVTVAARGERALALAARHADVWETSFCTPDEFRIEADRFDAALAATVAAGRPRPARSLEIDGFLAPTDAAVERLLVRVRTERGRHEDLDPILDRALLGTPDRAAERLAALAAAGVDQVVVALHDPTDPAALEALVDAADRAE